MNPEPNSVGSSDSAGVKAVPLAERLRSVPYDAVLRIDTPNALGCMDTRSIPVGRLCHEAAAAVAASLSASSSSQPTTAEDQLTTQGVFKGAHGLRGLLEADVFWERQMYGTRLYYGPGIADYLHRGVLGAAVEALDALAASPLVQQAGQPNAGHSGSSEGAGPKTPPAWRRDKLRRDDLPPKGTEVLLWVAEDHWEDDVHITSGAVHLGYVAEDAENPHRYLVDYMDTEHSFITHWMPLPAAPGSAASPQQGEQVRMLTEAEVLAAIFAVAGHSSRDDLYKSLVVESGLKSGPYSINRLTVFGAMLSEFLQARFIEANAGRTIPHSGEGEEG